MTTPIPFDIFSPELLPGETVEWTGRPNLSVIFHKEDWLVIPFSLLWGGFAIFWLLGASGVWDIWGNRPDRNFQWFGVIWGTPFVLVGQYLIWGRFVYSRWQKQRTYYALTNRRAIIVQGGVAGRTLSSAYFENMTMLDKRIRSDGIGSISFGGPVTGEWQWGKGNPPRCPTFDDIDNVDGVYQIAARLQVQAGNSAAKTSSRWPSWPAHKSQLL
jgi:hypothetical protein